MAIYNAERYIADFIKSIIEDGLDEGQDVCYLDSGAFIDENDEVITRPTLEEAKNVNKTLIASFLIDYIHEVFINSYEELIRLEEEQKKNEEKERKRLENSPSFLRGKKDGRRNEYNEHFYSSDYRKGYREGLAEYREGSK